MKTKEHHVLVVGGYGALGSEIVRGLVDAENTALIGYSMGGYGSLVAAGAGLTDGFINFPLVPGGFLSRYKPGSQAYLDRLDERIKTAVFFAPCCATFGFWDPQTLQGVAEAVVNGEVKLLLVG